MKPGRKPHTPTEKRLRGTFRQDRDAPRTEILVAGSAPMMPAYLSVEAVDVWREVLPRVMSAGVVELDSAAFARYCAAEAIVRLKMGGNEQVPAATLSALRQYEEAFRIIGPRSRVGAKVATRDDNPFRKNGIPRRLR